MHTNFLFVEIIFNNFNRGSILVIDVERESCFISLCANITSDYFSCFNSSKSKTELAII